VNVLVLDETCWLRLADASVVSTAEPVPQAAIQGDDVEDVEPILELHDVPIQDVSDNYEHWGKMRAHKERWQPYFLLKHHFRPAIAIGYCCPLSALDCSKQSVR